MTELLAKQGSKQARLRSVRSFKTNSVVEKNSQMIDRNGPGEDELRAARIKIKCRIDRLMKEVDSRMDGKTASKQTRLIALWAVCREVLQESRKIGSEPSTRAVDSMMQDDVEEPHDWHCPNVEKLKILEHEREEERKIHSDSIQQLQNVVLELSSENASQKLHVENLSAQLARCLSLNSKLKEENKKNQTDLLAHRRFISKFQEDLNFVKKAKQNASKNQELTESLRNAAHKLESEKEALEQLLQQHLNHLSSDNRRRKKRFDERLHNMQNSLQ